MPFDKIKYPEELWNERRQTVAETLRSMTLAELKQFAQEHDEHFIGDPARDEFLRLMAEQPQATFYHAKAQADAEILYCSDADFGVWFVPGSGMGPLDEHGKALMKQIIGRSPSA